MSTWQISPYYSSRWRYNISLKLGFDCWILWFIPIAPTKPHGKGQLFKIYNESRMRENNIHRGHAK